MSRVAIYPWPLKANKLDPSAFGFELGPTGWTLPTGGSVEDGGARTGTKSGKITYASPGSTSSRRITRFIGPFEDGKYYCFGTGLKSSFLLGPPTVAPTAADSGTAGNVDVGPHRWAYTWVTAAGTETPLSPISNVVTIAGSAKRVTLTGIRVGPNAVPGGVGPSGTNKRRIYRDANDGVFKLVGELAGNTATTFTDDVANASLGAVAPSVSTFVHPRAALNLLIAISGGSRPSPPIDRLDTAGVWKYQQDVLVRWFPQGVGNRELRLSVDPAGWPLIGSANFDDVYWSEVEEPDVELFLAYPNYRGIIWDAQSKKVEVWVRRRNPAKPELTTTSIVIRTSGNIIIFDQSIPLTDQWVKHTFAQSAIANMANGTYELSMETVGANDTPKYTITRQSAAPASVYWDENQKFWLKSAAEVPTFRGLMNGYYHAINAVPSSVNNWASILEPNYSVLKGDLHIDYTILAPSTVGGPANPAADLNVFKRLCDTLKRFDMALLQTVNAGPWFAAGTSLQGASGPAVNGTDGADAGTEYIAPIAAGLNNYPAFAGWYGFDERNGRTAGPTFRVKQACEAGAPQHFMWGVNRGLSQMREMELWRDIGDTLAANSYPVVNDLVNPGHLATDRDDPLRHQIHRVAEITRNMRAQVFNARPVWMTLQAYAKHVDSGFPTRAQFRSMMWAAICNGAEGTWWWSVAFGGFWETRDPVKRQQLREDLAAAVNEMYSYMPILSLPTRLIAAGTEGYPAGVYAREHVDPVTGITHRFSFNENLVAVDAWEPYGFRYDTSAVSLLAPVITAPVDAGATAVTGTGQAGATVHLFKGTGTTPTAIGTPSVVAGNGTWSITVPALAGDDVLRATQTLDGLVFSPMSTPVVVQHEVAELEAPAIDLPLTAAATTVSGFSRQPGSIEVYVDDVLASSVAVTDEAGGPWSVLLTVPLADEQRVKARLVAGGSPGPFSPEIVVAPDFRDMEIRIDRSLAGVFVHYVLRVNVPVDRRKPDATLRSRLTHATDEDHRAVQAGEIAEKPETRPLRDRDEAQIQALGKELLAAFQAEVNGTVATKAQRVFEYNAAADTFTERS